MAKVVGVSDHMKKYPQDIVKYRSQEWKRYNKNKKTSGERRQEFLWKRLMEYEADGNEKAATAVIVILKLEETSDVFWNIQGVLKPRAISSLNYIEIDDEDNPGKIKALHDKDEMEITMMKTFRAKFMEVYDTPMVHEPFISILPRAQMMYYLGTWISLHVFIQIL